MDFSLTDEQLSIRSAVEEVCTDFRNDPLRRSGSHIALQPTEERGKNGDSEHHKTDESQPLQIPVFEVSVKANRLQIRHRKAEQSG